MKIVVGIVVSGGIAPGINSVIKGIVSRHRLYQAQENFVCDDDEYELEIFGYMEGLRSLLYGKHPIKLHGDDYLNTLKTSVTKGGSLLTTARVDELLRTESTASERENHISSIVRFIQGLDILYVIGGDGSMRATHSIWRRARELGVDISIAAIPKTMDNDVLWVWQSFGFLSAVERAKQMLLQFHTEVSSNPRLGIMQLFGSDSGFVVSHAVLGSDVCDYALIPEVPFTLSKVCEHMTRILRQRLDSQGKPYGVIVMAETAIPRDIGEFLVGGSAVLDGAEKEAVKDFLKKGRRVYGQTRDELRRAGLKIVTSALTEAIRKIGKGWKNFRVVTSEPRHLIRSMEPSVSDVIFGERLGALAVDSAMAGYSNFMISQWLTEYVMVPLDLVVLGRKRLPRDGIFWKTVVASTGQQEEFQKEIEHWEDWWTQSIREFIYSKQAEAVGDLEWSTIAAHDAAESALKAFAVRSGGTSWGSAIVSLLNNLRVEQPAELMEAASFLDECYLSARYPSRYPTRGQGGSGIYRKSTEETSRAIASATRIVGCAQGALRELGATPEHPAALAAG